MSCDNCGKDVWNDLGIIGSAIEITVERLSKSKGTHGFELCEKYDLNFNIHLLGLKQEIL